MLLEVPYMAANTFDTKKTPISKNYRKLLENYERSTFLGPPENTRDIIVTAGKALATGDWKRCEELILGLPMWALMPKSDQVKAMVRRYLDFCFQILYSQENSRRRIKDLCVYV